MCIRDSLETAAIHLTGGTSSRVMTGCETAAWYREDVTDEPGFGTDVRGYCAKELESARYHRAARHLLRRISCAARPRLSGYWLEGVDTSGANSLCFSGGIVAAVCACNSSNVQFQ